MKRFKKIAALVVAGVITFASMPAISSQASSFGAPGIDSITTTSYSCKAANNISAKGDNVIKLYLKEENDRSSNGNSVEVFSVFTDNPEWIQVAVSGNGLDKDVSEVVDAQGFPNSHMVNSGMSMTVDNTKTTYDDAGNVISQGGAVVFLIANDYVTRSGNESDRTVSVSIVSRNSRNTISFEDITNITVDIDAAEPVVVEPEPEVTPEVEVTTPGAIEIKPEVKPADPKPHDPKPGDPKPGEKPEDKKPEPKPKDEKPEPERPEENVEEQVEEDAEEEPEYASEEYDEEEPDGVTTFNVGDEIETAKATYTVLSTSKGIKVEYTDAVDYDATSITIPKTITIDGIVCPVTAISDEAFRGNTNLKTVTIGSNVTEIGEKAFWGCKKLKTIKISSKNLTLRTVGKEAFKNTSPNVTIQVPKARMQYYKKIFKKRGLAKTAKFKKI